jgi:nitrogen fixation protein FixH
MKAMVVHPTRQITGRTVLFGLIAFFVIVAAVNGVFIYFALASWPGLSDQDAYKDGLRYNEVIEQARRQQALGWSSRFDLGANGLATVHIQNADGTAVTGLDVEISIARPVGDEGRTRLRLPQDVDGAYRGSIATLADGQWQVELVARRDGETRYRMIYYAWVRP